MKTILSLLTTLIACASAFCQQPEVLTLENVPDVERIKGDEVFLKAFSAEQAARYLDTASLNWQKEMDCATCHTNMSYMMARPALRSSLKDSGEVRKFFESYYKKRWKEGARNPENDYDPVVVGTALVFNDAQITGELSEITRKTLDTMWKTQRKDGGWDWAKCGWAPMEIDDHYGVTLAALTTGIAPDDYANTKAAKEGIEKIRQYLKNKPAPSLHHRIMIAWAGIRIDGLMNEVKRKNILKQMLDKQLPDGGWSTPSFLEDWKEFKRLDKKPHDVKTSDAYGTSLAIIFARESGLPASDKRLQKGISWLKSNQRESGKWFTRSPSKDSRQYFTNFGSAFAILALQSCDELPDWPFRAE